jgi:hypothetical protein
MFVIYVKIIFMTHDREEGTVTEREREEMLLSGTPNDKKGILTRHYMKCC